jgi:ribosomal protein L34
MGEDDGRRDAPPLSGNSVDFASPTAFESGPLDAAKTSSAASRGVDGDIGAAAAERAELRDRPRCARRTEVMSFDSRIVPLTLVPDFELGASRVAHTRGRVLTPARERLLVVAHLHRARSEGNRARVATDATRAVVASIARARRPIPSGRRPSDVRNIRDDLLAREAPSSSSSPSSSSPSSPPPPPWGPAAEIPRRTSTCSTSSSA